MNRYARDLWARAEDALRTAELDMTVSFDAAASRCYYAAFYAVCALFATMGKEFSKHSAARAAVHRDLVNAGLWQAELGRDYDFLIELRESADYGGSKHVTREDATRAITAAGRILTAVREMRPDLADSSPSAKDG